MANFDSDPKDLSESVKRFVEAAMGGPIEPERMSRRDAVGNVGNIVGKVIRLTLTATTAYLLFRSYHVFNYNELQIIYNNDPALNKLKQVMHGKMSQLSSAYSQVSERKPHYRLDNTPHDVTLAIRTDAMEFTQDFRNGRRQIEVVVAKNFVQNFPDNLLADAFIRKLKLQLMQAERNRRYYDMPVIRIY